MAGQPPARPGQSMPGRPAVHGSGPPLVLRWGVGGLDKPALTVLLCLSWRVAEGRRGLDKPAPVRVVVAVVACCSGGRPAALEPRPGCDGASVVSGDGALVARAWLETCEVARSWLVGLTMPHVQGRWWPGR